MKNNQILRPVLTEKATNMIKKNYYAFEVNINATKSTIKQELEKLYQVKVADIKIINRKGKIKRVGRKMLPKNLPDKKLAYVKLKEGKLDLFPQT